MRIMRFVINSGIFQSTLSMRRATYRPWHCGSACLISIHALHEESDRVKAGALALVEISIHALHEESDKQWHCNIQLECDFNPRSP